MKLIFDNNVPIYLLPIFSSHQTSTAFREGWQQLANGHLLSRAEEAGFELLVTLDRGFETQQNMEGRNIAVAVLKPRNQSEAAMIEVGEHLAKNLANLSVGRVIVVRKDS